MLNLLSRPCLISPRRVHMSDRIGLDIGGSLGKIVYFQPHAAGSHDLDAFIFGSSQYGSSGEREEHLSVSSCSPLNGRLHFIRFATHRMEGAIQLMRRANSSGSVCSIFATGGGAYKFEAAITSQVCTVYLQPQTCMQSCSHPSSAAAITRQVR